MSKKSRRKKQREAKVPQPSKVIFSFGAARMIREALRLVDDAFSRTTKPLTNLQLGYEALESLKKKLDDMIQLEDWTKETPFDYNELHIMYAAIHMYLVELALRNDPKQMTLCLQLCKYFITVIEETKPG